MNENDEPGGTNVAAQRAMSRSTEPVKPGMGTCWLLACLSALSWCSPVAGQAPSRIAPWMEEQVWRRDADAPILTLGPEGTFDDRHLFAPCVVTGEFGFRLWYCGSRGEVGDRVFRLGLAASRDGRTFDRHAESPVLAFPDDRSVLTPTILRRTDGRALLEQGRFRMWFSATDFPTGDGRHTLHEAFSVNGIRWTEPSPALLEGVYAPTIVRNDDGHYRMWFTNVAREPWTIAYASSTDGSQWTIEQPSVMTVDQPWEQDRLFYPHVVQVDGVFLMWYGSYWRAHENKTAIGFAASVDGVRWFKNPHNPVVRPEPRNPWESHYTTSHCVARLDEGHWRMWFATRTQPPFVHKYFALSTAVWDGP